MSTHPMTLDEYVDSLTGFDEIAITKAFGKTVIALSSEDPITFIRSLVFVAKRREGLNDGDAYNAAMGHTIREVNGYFAASEEEVMPDAPETEEGKGD